jgi:uncharacterized protein YdiU (UPF0061 family)
VLNTDNINVTGESFDYGPYRFLPHYDPNFTAAYFDRTGLYAYGRQPNVLHWNLQRLAECMRYIAEAPPLIAALEQFAGAFEIALVQAVFARLNLTPTGEVRDLDLVGSIYEFLQLSTAPFAQLFFDWQGGLASEARAMCSPSAPFYADPMFSAVRQGFAGYAVANPARMNESYFAREQPETLLIDEIEAIWDAIAARDDWEPLYAKVRAIEDAGRAAGNITDD